MVVHKSKKSHFQCYYPRKVQFFLSSSLFENSYTFHFSCCVIKKSLKPTFRPQRLCSSKNFNRIGKKMVKNLVRVLVLVWIVI